MLFSLLYFLLRGILRLVPAGGDERDRDLELLVLRHQVKVLHRKAGRPRLRRVDKALLAAAARVLPRDRWASFMVTPQTLMRWHRELVRRKWTYRAKRLGRPPLDPEIRELILRPYSLAEGQRVRRALGRDRAARVHGLDHRSRSQASHRILRTYAEHYNSARPHRGLALQTPEGSGPVDLAERVPEIQRRDLLGGLIHEYAAVAA